MAEYLVELYVSRDDPAAVERGAERARRGSRGDDPRRERRVRYLRAIFVPEDETCFFLYEAASAEAVHEAARGRSCESGRIIEALGARKGGPGPKAPTTAEAKLEESATSGILADEEERGDCHE